jgi:hypothetical protein
MRRGFMLGAGMRRGHISRRYIRTATRHPLRQAGLHHGWNQNKSEQVLDDLTHINSVTVPAHPHDALLNPMDYEPTGKAPL